MHGRSFALLVAYTALVSPTNGFWWEWTRTVTQTVTATQVVHTCTTKCSSFGAQSCAPIFTSSHKVTCTGKSSSTIQLNVANQKSSSITPNTASQKSSSTVPIAFSQKPSSAPVASSQRSSSLTPFISSQQSSSPTPSRPITPSSTPSTAPVARTFFIRANSPSQDAANGQYAVVSAKGFLQFSAADPTSASPFTLSASGQLLFNLRPASINPALSAAAIQFAPAATKLKARQAGTAPVTCLVTADTTGAALLQCAAAPSTIQQACGTGFYLAATLQCQPLTLTSITPGSAAATTNPPPGANPLNPFPGRLFSLQANGPPINSAYTGGYAAYFTTGGITELAFSNYISGAPYSLDTSGHLTGVGPCPPNTAGCTGNVAYAATFKIGDTLGPVNMMYGEIAAGYAPIVCQIPPGFDGGDGPTYSISCRDGASGASNVVQQCGSNIFNLGTALGAGCRATTVLVKFLS